MKKYLFIVLLVGVWSCDTAFGNNNIEFSGRFIIFDESIDKDRYFGKEQEHYEDKFKITLSKKVGWKKKKYKIIREQKTDWYGQFMFRGLKEGDYLLDIVFINGLSLFQREINIKSDMKNIAFAVIKYNEKLIADFRDSKIIKDFTKKKQDEKNKRAAQEQIEKLSKRWFDRIYSKRMEFFFGEDSIYKFLDKSVLSIIEPELIKIYEDSKNEILDTLNSKIKNIEYTGERYVDERFYNILVKEHPLADKGWLKSQASRQKRIAKEKYRSVEYDLVLTSTTPTWEELIKFAGGYSNLTKEGISKKDISNFKISTTLKLIEIINEKSFKAEIKIEGSQKALEYYKIKNPNIILEGNLKLPQISYDNLDNYFLYCDLGDYGKQKILLTNLNFSLHKKLISQKNIINIMFDDLVSIDQFDKALEKNNNTSKYSKENWVLNNFIPSSRFYLNNPNPN